jgi:hypothetical protein
MLYLRPYKSLSLTSSFAIKKNLRNVRQTEKAEPYISDNIALEDKVLSKISIKKINKIETPIKKFKQNSKKVDNSFLSKSTLKIRKKKKLFRKI